MSMAPAFLILNGKKASEPTIRDAVTQLRDEGANLQVRVTWEFGDCHRFITEAIADHCSTLIIGGGDGSLNEAVNSLMQFPAEQRPPLAVLPLGTANDFATSVGVPPEPEAALRLALTASAQSIDLGCVNQQHYFINVATGGFGTRITTETPEKLKSALGGASYFLHGLLRMDRLKPDRCTITSEQWQWQGDALVIAVGNGRIAGGGQRLCPTALINDQQLALTIITAQEIVPSLLHALTRDDENPNIINQRASEFSLTSEHTMTFNLDGEPQSGTHFHFKVLGEAIRFRLPPSCALLG
ncbi:lipid kinase YegS [Rosenbergiella sp. S61]|uniref:Probable lipid kinase YegS-like n=2 Tax=Rosenbergiella gaditana TaxID=2726987 RepID=A0ABS5SV76_9GAMM|nr:lipid kinase YegS [Rosenbergiella gaditana]MBT0723991.1 lipid kinase YegS [Rosenbergiella gaditana]